MSNQSLSWDDFKKMGNPENAPDLPDSDLENEIDKSNSKVRVFLDRKNRRGKEVTLIKGLDLHDEDLNDLAKTLKKKCGGGGSVKEGDIIIQGDHRNKVIDMLINEGYPDVKKSGG